MISDMSFRDSSVGKESACNEGDPGSISGLGRSPEEGIGYPLWYSWASLVAQLIKNLPAMQETWVGKIPWRRKGYPLQYSSLENSMDYIVHGLTKSQTWLSDFHFQNGVHDFSVLCCVMFYVTSRNGNFCMCRRHQMLCLKLPSV